MVVLYNHSSTDYSVKKGDKIAQLICEACVHPTVQVCSADAVASAADSTAPSDTRGTRGFGSTGY